MKILFTARVLVWSLWLWLRPRKPIGQVLDSGLDKEGRWYLKAQIRDDRIWRMIKGEYRPWRIRIVNFFRWLLGKSPKPYPRVSGFSITSSARLDDNDAG